MLSWGRMLFDVQCVAKKKGKTKPLHNQTAWAPHLKACTSVFMEVKIPWYSGSGTHSIYFFTVRANKIRLVENGFSHMGHLVSLVAHTTKTMDASSCHVFLSKHLMGRRLHWDIPTPIVKMWNYFIIIIFNCVNIIFCAPNRHRHFQGCRFHDIRDRS